MLKPTMMTCSVHFLTNVLNDDASLRYTWVNIDNFDLTSQSLIDVFTLSIYPNPFQPPSCLTFSAT